MEDNGSVLSSSLARTSIGSTNKDWSEISAGSGGDFDDNYDTCDVEFNQQ